MADQPFWTAEYTVKKGGTPLFMHRKRIGAPDPRKPLPVLFFVHGSSGSSKVFDLTVPGHGEYSMMNVFARYGFDCWAMDHDGYGRSGSSGNNSDIASGVEDLKLGIDLVVEETGRDKMHFLGDSSGALRAGAYAMVRPERVDRLVLVAFTYKGTNSPTLKKRAEQLEFFRANNRRPRGRDMIASIFTRDKPGVAEQAVAEALADEEMKFGDTVPTGTYLDMTANLPVVHPEKVLCPVLMVRGEHDGIASNEDLLDFYSQLPNGDRQYVILPGIAHTPGLSINRELYWHAVNAFLTTPAKIVG